MIMFNEELSFGDAEDEFMTLREILFAEIPKPDHLRSPEEVSLLNWTT